MSSAICFNLDQSYILLSGNGLNTATAESSKQCTYNSTQAILPYPFLKQALVFTCLQYKSFENTVGKG